MPGVAFIFEGPSHVMRTAHAVLYALDSATGDELYTSGDSMDSWNHYGGIALSGGNISWISWHDR